MKFNWGTGIFLFYGVFAVTLFYQVFASTRYSNDLVEDNYYEKDLAYQQRFERIENSMALPNPLVISFLETEKKLVLQFPEGKTTPTGKFRLYRADDEKKDLMLPLKLDTTGRMAFPTAALTPGFWRAEVEWEMGGVAFFDDEPIEIPKP